ncbi:TetR/AcrR family transcriptional regulator [Paramicrobacterium agarici]|uniref:TetR family transcriptional regulator n=1 Tax=Paramicrobacterium agarici TaxID=630514 RepID=A0A2A9DWP8_9MICO|nr:TetR/AcrR family transcriptional regulator [Microbacterium agarici]PFG31023.1 TetR family transcriptional regulator [Microbacterium agarici]TQO24087.1 TetR family transcriptional regulator [Microbacterium agarici]
MSERVKGRSDAKNERRRSLLDAAAALFSQHGFNGVSMEDLGTAVGVSGPAVYRHFPSKQAVLAELLIGVSTALFEGGTAETERAPEGDLALRALIEFHVDFAIRNTDVIRVHDRDRSALLPDDAHSVRLLQRRYVELWVNLLKRLTPDADVTELRVRAHAAFGLMNSTPYTVRRRGTASADRLRALLERMSYAALTS